MTRTKLQKILNKLDGRSEATAKVIADFDVSVKALRDKLEQDITVATLDEVNLKINKLRKSIDLSPVLQVAEELQTSFRENALLTLREIEDKSAELRNLIDEGNRTTEEKAQEIAKSVVLVEEKLNKVSGETSQQIKQVMELS